MTNHLPGMEQVFKQATSGGGQLVSFVQTSPLWKMVAIFYQCRNSQPEG